MSEIETKAFIFTTRDSLILFMLKMGRVALKMWKSSAEPWRRDFHLAARTVTGRVGAVRNDGNPLTMAICWRTRYPQREQGVKITWTQELKSCDSFWYKLITNQAVWGAQPRQASKGLLFSLDWMTPCRWAHCNCIIPNGGGKKKKKNTRPGTKKWSQKETPKHLFQLHQRHHSREELKASQAKRRVQAPGGASFSSQTQLTQKNV